MARDPKQPLVEALELELLNKEDAADYRTAVGALIFLNFSMFNFAAGPVSSMNFVLKRGFNMEVFSRDCLYIDYFAFLSLIYALVGGSSRWRFIR
jgi:hypothetical protein